MFLYSLLFKVERKDFRSDRASSMNRSLVKQDSITFFFFLQPLKSTSYVPKKMFLFVLILDSVITISVIFLIIKSLNFTFFIPCRPKWNEKTFDLTEQVAWISHWKNRIILFFFFPTMSYIPRKIFLFVLNSSQFLLFFDIF